MQTCTTCELELLGVSVSTGYCYNGDGTIDITTEGETETVDLEGISFGQFISALEQAGAPCNQGDRPKNFKGLF